MNPTQIEDRISTVVDAWSSLRPTKSFFGMTLDEFKASIKPSLDARLKVTDVRNNLTSAIVERDEADKVTLATILGVVAAVVGDKDEGNNGDLYKAMGYVRWSERGSGLSRPAANISAPAKAA